MRRIQVNDEQKQYEAMKLQRLKLSDSVSVLIQKCNELIEKENRLFKQLEIEKSQEKDIDLNIKQIETSLNSCRSVVDLYNGFRQKTNVYIHALNQEYRKVWVHFEASWSRWTANDIVSWFKYTTSEMNTDGVNWEKIERSLKDRNYTGESLKKFDNSLLEKIGLRNVTVAKHLVSNIKEIREKYNQRNHENALLTVDDDKQNEDIPAQYICPITKKIMIDPVMAFDGHCYEKSAIENYLKDHNNSPKTGENAKYNILFPNHLLKQEIEQYIKENDIDVL